jgi:hypothetical protein
MTTTSFGRRVPNDSFPQSVARRLGMAAMRSQKSLGDSPFVNNHVHALEGLANRVLAGGLEDQLVRTLFRG